MRTTLFAGLIALTGVESFLRPVTLSSFHGTEVLHGSVRSSCAKRIGSRHPSLGLAMTADGSTVLVSGFLNTKERTDQFVFDILQAQGKWGKIVAFSESMSFAKKRLISRKSRYSGLLDVLEFDEGDRYDAKTMEEKLQGCSAWLCFDCQSDKIGDCVKIAKTSGVEKIVLTSTISAADASSSGVEDILKESGLDYTFIRVGEVVDGKEGGAVVAGNVTDDLPTEEVIRDDIIRLSAEAFVLQNATNTAVAFGKGDSIALDYLKELRSNGTDRRTELDNLISGGLVEYSERKAAEEAERNKPPPTEEELAEKERLWRESREEEYAALRAASAAKDREDDRKQAEKEAEEYLEKEWRALYWARNTTQTMEEYRDDEENWERGMEYGYSVVRQEQREKWGWHSEDEDEEDEDDEDEEEEEGEGVEASEEEDVGEVEVNVDDSGSEVVVSSETNTQGTTKEAEQSDSEITQEIKAESKDENDGKGSDSSSPKAKLNDPNEPE